MKLAAFGQLTSLPAEIDTIEKIKTMSDNDIFGMRIDDNTLVIIKEENIYHLAIYRAGSFVVSDITPEKFEINTKYTLYYSGIHGICWLNEHQLNFSKEAQEIKRSLRIFESQPICNIYFADSYDNSLIFSNKQPLSDEQYFTAIDCELKSLWIHDYIKDNYPMYEDTYKKISAKEKLSRTLPSIDSIVMLEQQIDMLSSIVLDIIGSNSLKLNNLPTEFIGEFDSFVTETTSLQFRPDIQSALDKLKTERLFVNLHKSEYFKKFIR